MGSQRRPEWRARRETAKISCRKKALCSDTQNKQFLTQNYKSKCMAVFSDPLYTVNLTGRVMHYGQHDAPSLATVNELLYLGRTLLCKLSSCTMRAENFHIAHDKDTSFETYQIDRQLEKKSVS